MSYELPAGIAPATVETALRIAPAIRPEHAREMRLAMGGHVDLRRAIVLAAANSRPFLAGARGGRTLFVFGVAGVSAITGTGRGWMLGTQAMDREGVWIADVSRRMIPLLHRMSGAEIIENNVPADYRRALKWLRWLGFHRDSGTTDIGGVPHVRVWHRETP